MSVENIQIYGIGSFNDSTENAGVVAYASFSDTAVNSGTISVSAEFSLSAANHGTVTEVAVFQGNAVNTGTVAVAEFKDGAVNAGTVSTSAVFADSTSNTGTVAAAVFQDTAKNDGGTVTGNATFADTAENIGTIVGNAVFTDSAENKGAIAGDAIFADTTVNTGSVSGNAQVAETADNSGGNVLGNVVEYVPPANIYDSFPTTFDLILFGTNRDVSDPLSYLDVATKLNPTNLNDIGNKNVLIMARLWGGTLICKNAVLYTYDPENLFTSTTTNITATESIVLEGTDYVGATSSYSNKLKAPKVIFQKSVFAYSATLDEDSTYYVANQNGYYDSPESTFLQSYPNVIRYNNYESYNTILSSFVVNNLGLLKASSGTHQVNGLWYTFDGNGSISYASGTFQLASDSNKWYTFDGNGGASYANGTIQADNGAWYTFDGAGGGSYVASGILQLASDSNKWYTFDGAGGGGYASGTLQVASDSNKWYTFDGNGGTTGFASGTLQVASDSNKWYTFDGNGGGTYATGIVNEAAYQYRYDGAGSKTLVYSFGGNTYFSIASTLGIGVVVYNSNGSIHDGVNDITIDGMQYSIEDNGSGEIYDMVDIDPYN